MIESINITEFRGIKACDKSFNFSKINVFIGKNNSCKSALLEAIYLLPFPKIGSFYGSDKLQHVQYIHNIRNGNNKNSLIYGYSGSAKINANINSKQFSIQLYDRGSIETLFDGKKDIALSDITGLLNNSEQELFTFSFLILNEKDTNRKYCEYMQYKKNEIIKKGANTSVITLLNKYVDDNFTEIFWNEGELSVRKVKDNEFPIYIRLDDMGEGIKYAIVLMIIIEAFKPKIVLWDDFGSTIHPSFMSAMLKWLIEKDCQIFISTHSIDVLNEITSLENNKNTKLFTLRKENDIIYHNELTVDDLENLLNANTDPRRLVDRVGI